MLRVASDNSTRFILIIGLFGVLLTLGFIGLVVGTASYEHLRAVGQIVYDDGFSGITTLPLRLTPGRYQLLRGSLLVGVGSGLVLLVLWWRTNWISNSVSEVVAESQHGFIRLRRWWHRLPNGSRRLALGLLGLLVLIRVWYMAYYPVEVDEVTSYDKFVWNGPRVITTFYPIPNNHVLYNLLAWPFAVLGLSTRLVMRLPTVLLGTLGTAVIIYY